MEIKEYRNLKKLTQTDTAVLLNITKRQYINIEKDPIKTRVETFMKLVEVLELSDDDIIRIIRNKQREIEELER